MLLRSRLPFAFDFSRLLARSLTQNYLNSTMLDFRHLYFIQARRKGKRWALSALAPRAVGGSPYMGSLISTPTPAVGGSAGGASGYAPRRVLDRSALVLREARLTRGLCDHRPLQRGVPHGPLPVHAAARAPPRPRPCRRMHRATATIAARVPRRCPSCAFEPCAHPRANSSRTVGGMGDAAAGHGHAQVCHWDLHGRVVRRQAARARRNGLNQRRQVRAARGRVCGRLRRNAAEAAWTREAAAGGSGRERGAWRVSGRRACPAVGSLAACAGPGLTG